MNGQTAAILLVQWRMLMNFYRRHGQVTFILTTLLSAIWYGGFAVMGVFLASALAKPSAVPLMQRYAGTALFFIFLYWQGSPLILASFGGLLDIKKLMAYPIPEHRFFQVELLLRSLTALEMPLLLSGAAVGVLRNPALPAWCSLALVLFGIFNLFLGAGLRDLVGRLLGNKRIREIAIFCLIVMAAIPQLVIQQEWFRNLPKMFAWFPQAWLPWSATAMAASHSGGWGPWLVLAVFTAAAWGFGRWQFHRSLKLDTDARRAGERRAAGARFDFWSWPSRVFSDPLGALVEKEIRALGRTSRFRIVFFMGFSFGLLIWLPMVGSGGSDGWMPANFLSVVAAYALILLSDVCFYNYFGFDRTAAQFYYIAPIKKSTVLAAKNIAAAFFVVAEIVFVTVACVALRMPVTPMKVAEAACVCLVMTLFFLAIGNIGSTRSPRAQNPNDGWKKSGSGKVAMLAFLLYPVIGLPVFLAFLARYAFENDAAFFGVLGAGALVAGSFYWISLESAVGTMERDRERILTLLSQADSPNL